MARGRAAFYTASDMINRHASTYILSHPLAFVLQVLKDNVPGYRLLRDAPASSQNTFSFYD